MHTVLTLQFREVHKMATASANLFENISQKHPKNCECCPQHCFLIGHQFKCLKFYSEVDNILTPCQYIELESFLCEICKTLCRVQTVARTKNFKRSSLLSFPVQSANMRGRLVGEKNDSGKCKVEKYKLQVYSFLWKTKL